MHIISEEGITLKYIKIYSLSSYKSIYCCQTNGTIEISFSFERENFKQNNILHSVVHTKKRTHLPLKAE